MNLFVDFDAYKLILLCRYHNVPPGYLSALILSDVPNKDVEDFKAENIKEEDDEEEDEEEEDDDDDEDPD